MNLATSNLPIDQERVVAAIRAAEQRTSGEIRVLVARESTADAMADAKRHFERLGMTKTAARNGVLIFISPKSHAFAVIGDTGIHQKCGDRFWQELAGGMADRFRHGDFTAGLVQTIERAGALLAEHFPRQADDRNELSDDLEHG